MVVFTPLLVSALRSPVAKKVGMMAVTYAYKALCDENIREQIKDFIVPKIAGTFAPVNVPAEVEEYDPYLCRNL